MSIQLDKINEITHLFLPVLIQQTAVNIYHMSGTVGSAEDTKINGVQPSHLRIDCHLEDINLQKVFAMRHNISYEN